MQLKSPAFKNNAAIPLEYTCDSTAEVSLPLMISNIPEGTKSLALIMDDPDVPKVLRPDGVFDHWVLFNISADCASIPSGATLGIAGKNGRGGLGYVGPCPPSQYEPSEHR